MSAQVLVVDPGAGNLRSVCRALEVAGATVRRSRRAEDVETAERIVLPGVGAYASGMRALHDAGLVEPLLAAARRGTPILGICLGMQLLFDRGYEHGVVAGLGLVPGEVVALSELVRVPNMGWHALSLTRPTPWLDSSRAVYFAHSFGVLGEHPDAVATIDHGGPVVAAVQRGPVAGCQFHPEKSGPDGLKLLARWLEA